MIKKIFTRGLYDCDPIYNMRVTACFMCAEVLMAFSPLGFIILPSISVSTVYLGVMVSALWGGPLTGAYVGLAYGLCSMWKASVTATSANDLIFSPFYSTNPAASWILALVPRILFGFLCGLAYIPITKIKHRNARIAYLLPVSILLERLHSALTYWFMEMTFRVPGGFMKAWTQPITASRIKTWIVLWFTVLLFYVFYEKILSRRYYKEYKDTLKIHNKLTISYIILIIATFVSLGLATGHFMERQSIILFDIDGLDPASVSMDRMYQVLYQFVTASICAVYIIVVMYRHNRLVTELSRQNIALDLQKKVELTRKLEQIATHDPLTGLYNREGMAKIVDQNELEHHPVTFVLVDVDHFKEINDTYGHDEGDYVLKTIAGHLRQEFGKEHTFRLGGDEFVLLLPETAVHDPAFFFDRFPPLTFATKDKTDSHTITFSVGACTNQEGLSEDLYRLADHALYMAKNKGRDNGALINRQEECLYIRKQ